MRAWAVLTVLLASVALRATGGEGYLWHNVKMGEPMTTAYSMHAGKDGLMWIGTNHGLYTYDGYRAKRVCPEAPLFDSQVYGITEYGDTCYLGTNNGLLAFVPGERTGHAVRGDLPIEIRATIMTGDTLRIASLYGLYTYVPRTGEARRADAPLPHRAVYELLECAPGGDIYIGTYNGLCRYTPATGRYEQMELPVRRSNVFVNALAWSAVDSVLWVGLECGLVRYDMRSGAAGCVAGFDDVSVKSLAVRPDGLAVGTDGGLYMLDRQGNACLYHHDSRVDSSIGDDAIWDLYADSGGNVWAATEMGVSIGNSNAAVKVIKISDISHRGDGQVIYHFLRDSNGALWIGGSNGLMRMDDCGLRWFMPDDSRSLLSHNRVRDIYETPSGVLWVATDGGINRYDTDAGRFVNYRVQDGSGNFKANWAYGVNEDARGALWVGSYLGGVHVVERRALAAAPSGGEVTADMSFNSSRGLRNDFIGCLRRASDGAVWVKLFRDSAITRIDGDEGRVRRFDLSGAGVLPAAIVPGNGGSVWVGHDKGVTQVGSDGRVLRSVLFPAQQGYGRLLAMEMVDGELWAATGHALWAVDTATLSLTLLPVPEKAYTAVYHDKFTGKVLLGTTDEYVEVEPGLLRTLRGGVRLHVVGVEVDGNAAVPSPSIELPDGFRSVVVELSCLDFTPGRYRKYAYRLDGSGGEPWTMLPVGDNRVELRALPVGRHRLELMVAGEEGSAVVVELRVLPPWYMSAWAWVCYALFAVCCAVLSAVYVRRRRARALREAERRRTLAEVEGRIRLLGNISHDLKTPLSMIMGPAGKLREECAGSAYCKDIDTIYRNAVKLNELIHRSVELDSPGGAEQAESLLMYSRIDAAAFVGTMVEAWRERYADRVFVFSAEEPPVSADVDVVKYESIVNNLLSNAVKYTEAGATIDVSLKRAGGNVVLRVADDGPGIAADELSLIFQRHYRSPRTAGEREGTGIGLYLVRHYAALHGGSVEVDSRVGARSGTVFTVSLPAENENTGAAVTGHASGKSGSVLIVDDNLEIARFIAGLFENDFETHIAPDGATALAAAARFRPDVVIADQQMPGMSGTEMCRRMREIDALEHVPVVLLTGVDDGNVEAKSVEAGVDLFLTKPFDGALLRRRVLRLAERHSSMTREARLAGLADAKPIDAESQPERQLVRLNDIIEENISNPDMNVAFLSERSGLHPKHLYRLVKERLGVTPVEYIRQMRLRKAAHLIEQGRFSVSEVMYMVGFSSASYFAKCFQSQFGCKPKDYKGERVC